MDDNMILKEMYEIAERLLKKRYPVDWGCAAVVRAIDGRYFTSVYMDAISCSVELCFETGAILEAHKEDVFCTHSLSIMREDERSPIKIAIPCGVCQERLRYWGSTFKVAMQKGEKAEFITLKDISPNHWTDIYPKETIHDYFYYHK